MDIPDFQFLGSDDDSNDEINVVNVMEVEDDDVESDGDQEVRYDINLPAHHSYLTGLVPVPGRTVMEAGWEGTVPGWVYHNVVFPGETVPMLRKTYHDTQILMEAINTDRLFGLVFVDGGEVFASNYGVLCEVLEASKPEASETLALKARARHRFKLLKPYRGRLLENTVYMVKLKIKVLPDYVLCDPLKNSRFFSIGRHRDSPKTNLNLALRRADSISTPWPHFVYDTFDAQEIVRKIKIYFKSLCLENLPDDIVSLSFWVATNLTLSLKNRLDLFSLDNVLLRLYKELNHIQTICVLCCAYCITEICKLEDQFAMSKEGLNSNYCNIGGYVHNTMTLKNVTSVVLSGEPSLEYTWFPGYFWTIALCSNCRSHVGWRFTASKKCLRPQTFWGLSRSSLTPKECKDISSHPIQD